MSDLPRSSRLTWSHLKIARAETHLAVLQADVNTWAASGPFEVNSKMAEDRLSYEVRLQVDYPPPLREWSLGLGDVVHNLRSSLDSAIWTLSIAGVPELKNPRLIQFPVVQKDSAWPDEVKKRLPNLDGKTVELLRSLQPFMRTPDQQGGDGLVVLQHLSNTDKHQGAITSAVVPQSIKWDATVGFEDESAGERNVPPDTTFHTPEIRDGALLLQHRTKDRIKRAPGSFGLGFQVSVDTPVGRLPMIQTLGGLCSYTRQVIGLLERSVVTSSDEEPLASSD